MVRNHPFISTSHLNRIVSCIDLQWSRFKRNTLAPEIAYNLLSGYKTVFEYMESNSSDPNAEGHYLESFQALTTENCFLPIFAETYTQLLLKSSEPGQAEEFIRKLVFNFFSSFLCAM